ncbi:MAG: hypothetical protein AB2A00_31285 [Myxococcota bacterium]
MRTSFPAVSLFRRCWPFLLALVACELGPRFLEVDPAPDTSDPVGPYRVRASMTQDDTVKDVSIFYDVHPPLADGGSPDGGKRMPLGTQRTRMVRLTPGVYEGDIPGQPVGSTVEYRLVATDVLGMKATAPEEPEDRYTLHITAANDGPHLRDAGR